jgi:hypothetical protein
MDVTTRSGDATACVLTATNSTDAQRMRCRRRDINVG